MVNGAGVMLVLPRVARAQSLGILPRSLAERFKNQQSQSKLKK
jgi:hypothetical protein